jgi:hypothetical protein
MPKPDIVGTRTTEFIVLADPKSKTMESLEVVDLTTLERRGSLRFETGKSELAFEAVAIARSIKLFE